MFIHILDDDMFNHTFHADVLTHTYIYIYIYILDDDIFVQLLDADTFLRLYLMLIYSCIYWMLI